MSEKEQKIFDKCRQVAQSCAVFNLRKASRALTQFYETALRPSGLRVTQFTLIVAVRLFGSTTISRLADTMVMDRTTLTRNLKLMEKKGFITTIPGEDRRERVVVLTEPGKESLENALPLWEKAQREIVDALGHRRFDEMLANLMATVSLVKAP
ncbi:MAG: winged helix-turn-helix transcriptional regulator [Deltaproteobacteria bacterium]|nr:MAG: winged helix-turn-helix transcriptional regulator [Deltaproteobacteria bacterium]